MRLAFGLASSLRRGSRRVPELVRVALAAAAIVLPLEVAMPQPWGELVRRDHVLVAGGPGCGKTPFTAELAASARRVVYFDPTGEWAPLGEVVPAEQLEASHFRGTLLRLVVEPRDEQLAKDFRRTLELARGAAAEGGLVLLVDEVGDLNPACAEELQGLHRNGHKDGIASILVSPCMTDFPKRCRDTASRVFTFFQKSARDRATLADEYGETFARRAATWRYPQPPACWVSPTLHV